MFKTSLVLSAILLLAACAVEPPPVPQPVITPPPPKVSMDIDTPNGIDLSITLHSDKPMRTVISNLSNNPTTMHIVSVPPDPNAPPVAEPPNAGNLPPPSFGYRPPPPPVPAPVPHAGSDPAALGFMQYYKCESGEIVSLRDTGTPDACLAQCRADKKAVGCWWLDGTGGFPRDCRVCHTEVPGKDMWANDWGIALTK